MYLYDFIIAINIVFISESRKKISQVFVKVGKVCSGGGPPGNDDDVELKRHVLKLASNGLPKAALYPVSDNGPADFSADSEPHPAEGEPVCPGVNN
jgi:hypothetical protein